MGLSLFGTLFGTLSAILNSPALDVPGLVGPYRPPQWSLPDASAVTLTLTATTTSAGGQQTTTAYIFDAILHAEHEQNTVITLNPVQTGAALTDHAYTEPATITFEVKMSDSVQSFIAGQFANAPSRSVAAYQTLSNLQLASTPIQIATRMRQYSKMLIRNLRVLEDAENRYGARILVMCQQVLTASVEKTHSIVGATSGPLDSELPQTTGQTATGQVQPITPVPAAVQQQNSISNAPTAFNLSQQPAVDGAGNWSSYNVNGLTTELAP